ncbi:MAG: transposase [Gammaproteobacteria bacterium]
MATRKRYTKQFKLEAVRLLKHADKPAAEVARELGIRRNQLYKWKQVLRARGDEVALRGVGA